MSIKEAYPSSSIPYFERKNIDILKTGEEAIQIAKDMNEHIKLLQKDLDNAESKLVAIDKIVNDEILFATPQEQWFIEQIRDILKGCKKWIVESQKSEGKT